MSIDKLDELKVIESGTCFICHRKQPDVGKFKSGKIQCKECTFVFTQQTYEWHYEIDTAFCTMSRDLMKSYEIDGDLVFMYVYSKKQYSLEEISRIEAFLTDLRNKSLG